MTPDSTVVQHPRSKHLERYDFEALVRDTPELGPLVLVTPAGERSIDFANPTAVKLLNRALLKTHYGVAHWDIPPGYLCPPIPSRADYLHHLADLLAAGDGHRVPRGSGIRILDVGVGANCIYPLVGQSEYGWRFLGSDVDETALAAARTIVQANRLETQIELRQQRQRKHIFTSLLARGETFEASLCNPPFHGSLQEAQEGSQRKWRGLRKGGSGHRAPVLNFGGQGGELWCDGGEAGFIRQMIEESVAIRGRVLWFSSLVSRSANLPGIYRALNQAQAVCVKTVEMLHGQKQSRFVAWSFLDARARRDWLRAHRNG